MRERFPFLTILLVFHLAVECVNGQSIPAGKMIHVTLTHGVTTKSAKQGDAITASVAEPLKADGRVVIPAGSVLHGRVDFIQRKSATDDGWLRLIFTRFELPGGSVDTLASASFTMERRQSKRTSIFLIGGLATLGYFLGGRTKRAAGGLGGAILGVVIVENQHRYGHDLTLGAGRVIGLRLGDDLVGLGGHL